MKAANNFLAGLTLAALAASAPMAISATTFSSVLGYYTIDAPAGSSIWVSGLVRKKLHQGDIDGVSGPSVVNGETVTTFTESDRDLGAISEADGYPRHYIEILEEGASQGLILDIVPGSAGSNSIQVLGDVSSLPSSASFCIREHVTLGDLFPVGAGFAPFTSTLRLFHQDATSDSFTYTGNATTPWALLVSGQSPEPATDEIIYPGQGFIISVQDASPIVVGRNGVSYVKDSPTRIPLYDGAVNIVGLVNPLVGEDPDDSTDVNTEPLAELGLLDVLAPFQESLSIREQDGDLTRVGDFQVAMPGGERTFFSTNNTSDEDDANQVPVAVGSGVIVNVNNDTSFLQPVLHPTSSPSN